VIKSAKATIIENILNRVDGVSKNRKRKTGKATPALIDESETYPVRRKTHKNTPKHMVVSKGFRARRTPNTVATPLPPLKPAKTGKI
jgi:hypothetical protein